MAEYNINLAVLILSDTVCIFFIEKKMQHCWYLFVILQLFLSFRDASGVICSPEDCALKSQQPW